MEEIGYCMTTSLRRRRHHDRMANLIEEPPDTIIQVTIEKNLNQGFDYRRITIEGLTIEGLTL